LPGQRLAGPDGRRERGTGPRPASGAAALERGQPIGCGRRIVYLYRRPEGRRPVRGRPSGALRGYVPAGRAQPDDPEFAAASEAAYGLLTATIERCRAAGRLHGHSLEVVAVSAWSLVHGLSALWLSGRLAERITEQDPQRLAAAVSDLFVDAVLPPPERTAESR
jgi:Tetracyclin repressor-like, C-terminal domain